MKKIFITFAIILLVISGIFITYYIANNKTLDKIAETNNQENSKADYQVNKADYQVTRKSDYKSTKPEDLYKDADLVIEGKYVKDNKCYVTDYSAIVTEAKFEVSKVIKGNYTSKNININYYGGTVSVGEYIKNQTAEQIAKKGISDLSTAQLSNQTVEYIVEDAKIDANTKDNYIIFLSYNAENNYYFVLSDGYGMRKLSNNKEMYNLDTKTFETKVTDLK